MKTPKLLVFVFLVFSFSSSSQSSVTNEIKLYESKFQVSLYPHISTNGRSSESYINDFSINLLGGLSAGNNIFELGVISNFETSSVRGIQLAGLANVIGTNAFNNTDKKQRNSRAAFEANQRGFQAAGLLNYVRNNSRGAQIAGVFNIAGSDFTGIQLAGLGNSSGKYAQGIQLAGLYNLAEDGIGGVQIAALLNYTRGQLGGAQVALMNKATRIKGKNSSPPDKARGLQIGLLNFCKEMDGTQIGLINFGGEMHGRQIGLINFYRKDPPKENVKSGMPVGLINIGSMGGYMRLSFNEIFPMNIDFTTGNCANCTAIRGSNMPYNDRWKKLNQNALLLGYNKSEGTWGFGYGFQRVLLNKYTISPKNAREAMLNERKMISYGIKFMHLNNEMKLDRTFNLVSRINLEYGMRFRFAHIFAGVALNYFLDDSDQTREEETVKSVHISTGKAFGVSSFFWPGYSVGLHFK